MCWQQIQHYLTIKKPGHMRASESLVGPVVVFHKHMCCSPLYLRKYATSQIASKIPQLLLKRSDSLGMELAVLFCQKCRRLRSLDILSHRFWTVAPWPSLSTKLLVFWTSGHLSSLS